MSANQPPNSGASTDRFKNLMFDDFKRLASDASLSRYEKIGFPDSYRAGFEENIFSDIVGKLSRLSDTGMNVLDIGPGCSELPLMMVELCRRQGHQLTLVDSAEMLALLPDASHVDKLPGQFPDGCRELLVPGARQFDVILAYSMLHYVFPRGDVFSFLDQAVMLLAPSGQLLIGDIPNVSKRKRFFSSARGEQFHKNFMGTETGPEVTFNCLEPDLIDDSIVFGLLMRARLSGFDAYVVPQGDELPMANRREDILVTRP